MAAPDMKIAGKKWEMDPFDDDAVRIKDRSGTEQLFRDLNGVYVNYFYHLPNVKRGLELEFRPDDVYLPGYPRTGTNWTNEKICMLLRGKAETIPEFKPQLEMIPDDLDKLPSPRVINAHMPMSSCPKDMIKKKCKVVYTLRDPKDVAVSMYGLIAGTQKLHVTYRGTFEDYLLLFLDGTLDFNGYLNHWLDSEKFSEENPDIPFYYHVYEEALQKPLESVQKLSDFLGLPRNDDLCRAIADKCEFSKLSVDKKPYTLEIDGETPLFRQGKVGDWKNYFTEDMLDYYYKVYDEKMAGSRFYKLYARKN